MTETRMKEPCATCAFRQGTEANKDQITQLKVQLCLGSGTPFLCHEPQGEGHMCGGFANALEAAVKRGDYKDEDDWRRSFMRACLDEIGEFEQCANYAGVSDDWLLKWLEKFKAEQADEQVGAGR